MVFPMRSTVRASVISVERCHNKRPPHFPSVMMTSKKDARTHACTLARYCVYSDASEVRRTEVTMHQRTTPPTTDVVTTHRTKPDRLTPLHRSHIGARGLSRLAISSFLPDHNMRGGRCAARIPSGGN